MELKFKDNQSVAIGIDMDNAAVVIEVRNHTPLRLDMTKVHPDILKRAAYAGMAQVRLVDAAAVGRERKDGSIKSNAEMLEEKYAAIRRLVEHYESGSSDWSPRGPRAERDDGLVVAALIRLGKAADNVSALDLIARAAERHGVEIGEMKRRLAKARDVAQAILDIRAERLAADGAGVEADDLLDELAGA